MKKILSLIVGIAMMAALFIGSGDPMPGTSWKTIVITELICLAVLVAGVFYFRKVYGK